MRESSLKGLNTASLLELLHQGDSRALARCISIVENDRDGSAGILENLKTHKNIPIIGITGPPGAGKSTLVSALAAELIQMNPGNKIGILAVDPTSPFTHGSLLGDRLRMTEHYNTEGVFIRSIATRGAMGGLSARTIEITDVMRAAGFDFIFLETVGVGQSELDVASLADCTVVVLVPESGDEIQTIKSGIMEIADVFVVNKADRPGADAMMLNLEGTLHEKNVDVPVIKTVATTREGIQKVLDAIHKNLETTIDKDQSGLLYQKALRILLNRYTREVESSGFHQQLEKASQMPGFNLYSFIASHFPGTLNPGS